MHLAIQFCSMSFWAKDLSQGGDIFKAVRRPWATSAGRLVAVDEVGSGGSAAGTTFLTGDSEGPHSRPPHMSPEAP